jgi:hypothetical protein
MASPRSKLIWDRSIPLPDFVTSVVMRRSTEKPLFASRFRWQLAELLLRIADGLWGRSDVPQEVKNAVMDGTLIATGERAWPSTSRGPVEIPPDQFRCGRFRLLESTMQNGEFCYRKVRIAERAALPKAILSERPNQELRSAKIKRVFVELNASHEMDGLLRKQQVPIAREALENAGIKNIGTDKTIERLIRDNSR